VSCSLLYAAPEAINAHIAAAELTVEPSLDVWAIGVIVYECLTGTPTFSSLDTKETVFGCAKGDVAYPWERDVHELPDRWRRSRARNIFGDCLSRDAAARPTAAQLVKSLGKLNSNTTN
jgi:serine/threonine protein kinase